MGLPATAAAVLAAQAIEREGLRLAGALVALVLAPALILVLGAGMLLASLFGGVTGGVSGGTDLSGEGDLPPAVPPAHLVVMLDVSRDTGVPWQLLASIASVESGFGQNMSTSWAGAIGYGQFLPSSWAHWGNGGDPYDYRDAIPAMARYLLDHGVLADVPRAVYGYNHAWDYVALVLDRAATYAALGPNPAAAQAAQQVTTDGDAP